MTSSKVLDTPALCSYAVTATIGVVMLMFFVDLIIRVASSPSTRGNDKINQSVHFSKKKRESPVNTY